MNAVTRVESDGSYWEFDDDLMRYRRWPKQEKPRENGWGGPDAGHLQDAVWHDMESWAIRPEGWPHHLVIFPADGSGRKIVAPMIGTEATA